MSKIEYLRHDLSAQTCSARGDLCEGVQEAEKDCCALHAVVEAHKKGADEVIHVFLEQCLGDDLARGHIAKAVQIEVARPFLLCETENAHFCIF